MPEITYPRTIRAVYVRSCLTTNNKQAGLMVMLNEAGDVTRDELVFPRKSLSGCFPGAIYEFDQAGETSFRVASRKYVGTFADKREVSRWQLEDKAREVEAEAARMEKKDRELNLIVEALGPLRSIYRTALPTRKRAIEALILDYIRR